MMVKYLVQNMMVFMELVLVIFVLQRIKKYLMVENIQLMFL